MVSASVGRLVVAVAAHPGEPQRDPAGVARRCLDPVDGDLDDLLGPDVDDVPLGRDRQFLEALGLPPQHLVGHALERLADHDEPAVAPPRAEVQVRQPPRAPAVAPLDGEHDEVERVDRLHLAPRPAAPTGVVRRGEVLHHHSLVAAGDRGVEEALRFVRVGGDDRGQPRDARHGRREQLPAYRQRLVDDGVAADVEDVEEERRQSGATTRRVGAEVAHRVLEAPRRCRRRARRAPHRRARGHRRAASERDRRRRRRRSVTSLRLRVKSLTSSPRRWAWMRAPSSFHSTEASPVSPMAAATSVAGEASIGCTGRNGVNSIAASAGAPPVERGACRDRQRAGHHRRPLHVTSGDVGRVGDGGGHHAVERALTQFAADDAEHEPLLGLGGPLEQVAQDPATFAGRPLTRRRRQAVRSPPRRRARRAWHRPPGLGGRRRSSPTRRRTDPAACRRRGRRRRARPHPARAGATRRRGGRSCRCAWTSPPPAPNNWPTRRTTRPDSYGPAAVG